MPQSSLDTSAQQDLLSLTRPRESWALPQAWRHIALSQAYREETASDILLTNRNQVLSLHPLQGSPAIGYCSSGGAILTGSLPRSDAPAPA